jgi:aminopeptidase N
VNTLRQTLGRVVGVDLQPLFQQWIQQPGAPELRLSGVTVDAAEPAYLLHAVIEQVQPGPAYQLRLPLAVWLDGQAQAWQDVVVMTEQRLPLTLEAVLKF